MWADAAAQIFFSLGPGKFESAFIALKMLFNFQNVHGFYCYLQVGAELLTWRAIMISVIILNGSVSTFQC